MNFCKVFYRFECLRISFSQIRPISFYWITKIFNSVDSERIKQIGANLVCAEWLLRNGAFVRFKGNPDLISDYNKLMELEALSESSSFRIEEVYAKEATLTEMGFEHFKNCSDILRIAFILCPFNDGALVKLGYVKNSLQFLEVRSCVNIKDAGVMSLTQLSNLRKLTLADLNSIKKKDECEIALRNALPKCQIDFR